MLTCKVCNREFSTYRALGVHLKRSHKNIIPKDYYRKYIGTESDGYCPSCGKECGFISLNEGFHKYCSQICTVNAKDVIEKARNTKFSHYGEGKYFSDESLEKISKANHENAKERYEKLKISAEEKYGSIENFYKLNLEKRCATNLKKYGNTCSLHGSNQEKTEKIFLERFGYKSPVKSEKVKEKIKQTNRLRRNCDWPWADPNVIKKREENYFKKTGYRNSLQNPEIIEKRKETYFNKTGYYYPTQNPDVIKKQKDAYFKKTGYIHPFQDPDVIKNFYKKLRYKNINFDSSWELAYYIWLEDHKIDFEYHTTKLEYFINDEIHYYYPDFIVNGEIIEIKGNHLINENCELIDPKTGNALKEKTECLRRNNVKIITDCSEYINYINENYGRDYLKQFKVKK